MRRLTFLFLLAIGLVLAACNSATLSPSTQLAVEPTAIIPTLSPASTTEASAAQSVQTASAQSLRLPELTDNQGAVTVFVKPLDLDISQDKLSFEVSLDTHSVDLSMDLAALATLAADNGQSVQAAVWDAPLGGHHVSGTLSFPANVEGKAILEGASKLTLIIKDVDAPERVFTWDLK